MALPSPRMRGILSSPPDAASPRPVRLHSPRLDPAKMRATAGSQSEATVQHQNHCSDQRGSLFRPPARFLEGQRKLNAGIGGHSKTNPIAHCTNVPEASQCTPRHMARTETDPITHRHPEVPNTVVQRLPGAAGAATPRVSPVLTPRTAPRATLHLGGEDLGGVATRKYVKSDCPPSAAYGAENERRHKLPAQRKGPRPTSCKQHAESTDMKYVMRSPRSEMNDCKPRPLKPTRLLSEPVSLH
mmetsp:Transcript_110973/g.220717  ORF Transcript_110973/g.220717 Transcript_110973/m.220717 type:complete len:243 (-) Transcript_110973:146-874(-)